MGDNRPTENNCKNYPLRNEPVVLLYTDSVSRFFEEVESRTFVRYLIKSFCTSLGCNLPAISELEWKYSFETLYSLLKRVKANPKAGISIYLVRNIDGYFISVLLGSKDENDFCNLCLIAMLPWGDFRFSDKNGIVEYRDNRGLFTESINPSALASSVAEYLSSGCSDPENFDFRTCVYFFDAGRGSDNYISPELPGTENTADFVPDFYATEGKNLFSYIRPSVTGFDGRNALKFITSLKHASENGGAGTIEGRYYDYLTLSYCLKKVPFLMALTGRFINRDSGKPGCYLNYGDKSGIKSVIIRKAEDTGAIEEDTNLAVYLGYVPEKIDFGKVPYNVVIVDTLALGEDEFSCLAELQDNAAACGAQYHQSSFNTVLGFSDEGGGNNWLIRHFNLGLVEYQRWYSKLYSIEVADDVSQLRHESGIEDVVVPDSFRYNPESGAVESSPEDRREMYRRILRGRNGVRLHIADAGLKQYISAKIEESKNRYNWIDRLINEYGGNADKIMEAQSQQLGNSGVQAKYRKYITGYIGQSAWDKLSGESKGWLVSALLSYNDMKEYRSDMDFSGVVLMISKVFEYELKQRIAVGFVKYLKKKYGGRYADYLPSPLLKGSRYRQTPKNPESATMGDIPFIMGLNPDGSVYSEDGFRIFSNYAGAELFPVNSDIRSYCSDIVKTEDHIRRKYRNVSAHSRSVNVILATECISDAVIGRKLLETLMDKFRY